MAIAGRTRIRKHDFVVIEAIKSVNGKRIIGMHPYLARIHRIANHDRRSRFFIVNAVTFRIFKTMRLNLVLHFLDGINLDISSDILIFQFILNNAPAIGLLLLNLD